MSRLRGLVAVLVIPLGLNGIDQVVQGPDLDDLYPRLAESSLVVRGRVVGTRAVAARASEDLDGVWKANPQGPIRLKASPGGALFTVAVDEVVCRRSDFDSSASSGTTLREVRVFVPLGSPQSTPSRFDPNRRNGRELLLPGAEYLLFLVEPPASEEPVKRFILEPGVAYYRTMEGDRGAVLLADSTSPEEGRTFVAPLVQAVTAFCEAMKGPDAATKIRQLEGVRDRFDYPAWRQSVDRAIRELQGPPRRLP